MDNGRINFTYDGRVSVSFQLAVPHSPDKVWRAITERQYLDAWFPADVDFDLTPGAELLFKVTPEQVERYGISADHVTRGTVISVHPHRILEFLWDADTLHWELAPDGTGGCWLTLTHTMEDEDSAYTHAAGWHAGLEVVAAQLDGREVDWSPWDRAEELTPQYRKTA